MDIRWSVPPRIRKAAFNFQRLQHLQPSPAEDNLPSLPPSNKASHGSSIQFGTWSPFVATYLETWHLWVDSCWLCWLRLSQKKKDLQELADIYSVFQLFPACHIASLAGGGGRASDRLSQALHRPIWHPGVATGDLGDFVAVSFGPEISFVNSTMNILYRYFWYMYVYIHKCTL